MLSSLDEERGDKVILSGKEIVWRNEDCRLKKEDLENPEIWNWMRCEQSRVVELADMRWLAEVLKPESRLIICGAGHVACRASDGKAAGHGRDSSGRPGGMTRSRQKRPERTGWCANHSGKHPGIGKYGQLQIFSDDAGA